jgi:hypothetical protein
MSTLVIIIGSPAQYPPPMARGGFHVLVTAALAPGVAGWLSVPVAAGWGGRDRCGC